MGKLKLTGRGSRAKGARGELELLHLLEASTGLALARQYGQAASGGHDIAIPTTPVICVEVKRQETLAELAWWRQATASAAKVDGTPVVIWRQNRQPWRVRCQLAWLVGTPWPPAPPEDQLADTAVISVPAFVNKLNEVLGNGDNGIFDDGTGQASAGAGGANQGSGQSS
jgi:hypothetical protein